MRQPERRCLALAILGAALCLGCGDGAEPVPEGLTFEDAAEAEAASFVRVRDALLAGDATALDAEIARVEQDAAATWSQQDAGYVLRGWRAHESAFRALLEGPRETDLAGNARYSWVYDPVDQLSSTAPLMHELLLRGTAGEGGRLDAASTLTRLLGSGVNVRTDLLLGALGANGSDDPKVRAAVSGILAGTATVPIELDAALETLHYELSRDPDGLDVTKDLVDVVTRLARKEDPETRETVARELSRGQAGKRVGDAFLAKRLALVPSPTSSAVVATYLTRLTDPLEHRWGVRAAPDLPYSRQLGSYLLRVAKADHVAFTPGEELRLDALRAFGALGAKLPLDTEGAQAELDRLIKGLEPSDDSAWPPADGPLREANDEILDLLKGRR